MIFPVPGNVLLDEQAVTDGAAPGFRGSARSAGQDLRNFGFQAIAFLLGMALAFM